MGISFSVLPAVLDEVQVIERDTGNIVVEKARISVHMSNAVVSE